MGQLFHLESFDDVSLKVSQTHPEFERGRREGEASANAANNLRQNTIREELIAALSDAQFTYSEARQTLLLELRPVFEAITTSVLPSLATAGLAAVVEDMLIGAITDAAPKHPTIAVHPDHLDALTTLLAGHPTIEAKLQADSSIPLNAAWLTTGNDETSIDFKNVIEAIEAALGSYKEIKQRTISNG